MIRYKDCDKYLLSFLNNVNARTNNAYKDTKTFYEHVLSVTTGIVLEAMEDMDKYQLCRQFEERGILLPIIGEREILLMANQDRNIYISEFENL